jgi:hypothetical protein
MTSLWQGFFSACMSHARGCATQLSAASGRTIQRLTAHACWNIISGPPLQSLGSMERVLLVVRPAGPVGKESRAHQKTSKILNTRVKLSRSLSLAGLSDSQELGVACCSQAMAGAHMKCSTIRSIWLGTYSCWLEVPFACGIATLAVAAVPVAIMMIVITTPKVTQPRSSAHMKSSSASLTLLYR